MSELRVDSVKSKGGGAPDLPKGVTISGIATAATLGATTIDVSNVNVSGVVTSGTLSGPLLSTGTPTLGLGVTINSSGVVISGVATAGIVSATTLYGDGTNLTGIGASIAPLFYQPDPYDTGVLLDAGIGITFNSQVKAGTGNVTLSIANAGVAGTVVENFGVGSSVSISENRITINPTADISATQVYHLSYPSGCFTNNEGTDYVGTAYTFEARSYSYQAWVWGANETGQLGQNNKVNYSSPVQVPGNWKKLSTDRRTSLAITPSGELWAWGNNYMGQLGQNSSNPDLRSSPVQVGSDTTWSEVSGGNNFIIASKTDGTLWSWGYNHYGNLGQNDRTHRSSPVQIPGTTWTSNFYAGDYQTIAVKTDGTLWVWGDNEEGTLGLNAPETSRQSSPTQIPGTTWSTAFIANKAGAAVRTDGTMWTWGSNGWGEMAIGVANPTKYSSPVQVPGTTWALVGGRGRQNKYGLRTDGTLWAWGDNPQGELGQNNETDQVSPIQIPGTTWVTTQINRGEGAFWGIKTDGTLWGWGGAGPSQRLGQNAPDNSHKSSPTQIPGTTWHSLQRGYSTENMGAIKKV